MKKNVFLKRLLLAAMMSAPFGLSAQVTIGSGDLPQATLDIIGDTVTVHGEGFRLIDGNQAPGKVLTCQENGIGSWQPVAAFPTATVTYDTIPRIFATGGLGATGLDTDLAKVRTSSITANTINGFSLTNDNMTIPAGDYFIYFNGDISSSEYCYAALINAADTTRVVTLTYEQRLERTVILHLDVDTEVYFAIMGFANPDPESATLWNPSPTFYLKAANYAAGLNSAFQITFVKYQ